MLDTSKVTSMELLFHDCENLEKVNVRGWNTSQVTSMKNMFHFCYKITELDLRDFDTKNVTDNEDIFTEMWNLSKLNISNMTITSDWNTDHMITSSLYLNEINVPANVQAKIMLPKGNSEDKDNYYYVVGDEETSITEIPMGLENAITIKKKIYRTMPIVTLNKTSLNMLVGEEENLTAVVSNVP